MGEFQHGLLGCFDNCGICIFTYFLPCVTAGKVAEAVGESCCLHGCLVLLGPFGLYSRTIIRGKVRESKGIEGSTFNDCLLNWLCGLCTLIQEAQEIEGAPAVAMARE